MHELKFFLDNLEGRFHKKDFLYSDPLLFPHRYTDPLDQEAVALIAAQMAYGNVQQILRSVEELLRRMTLLAESPQALVRSLQDSKKRKQVRLAFEGFVHRFHFGSDFFVLLCLLSRTWEEHGSLGAYFLSEHRPEDRTIEGPLNRVLESWKRQYRKRHEGQSGPYFLHLLSAPTDGSCCKRWCMFLRWMIRKDALDLGIWAPHGTERPGFLPGQLVIPLDTHTGRISQYLGLTARRALNWKAALEVTAQLRKFAPEDPVRYDFSLSRMGILDLCQKKFRPEICSQCELLGACQFAKERKC